MKLTNEQKTRLLAEGVMGWLHIEGSVYSMHVAQWLDADGVQVYSVKDWQPLTNESHAAEVREQLLKLGWYASQSFHPGGLNTASVFIMPDGPMHHANAGTATETLCHAALLAMGLAKEEEL